MRKLLFITAVMLSAGMSWAGNVKILKTKYAGADYDLMSGPYMTVNVKLLASHVEPEECACFVLVNNEQWDGENMTIPKLSKLTKTMCFGEAEVDAVTDSKILEIPMSIVMDQKRLTGRDTTFYMKTFVVDFNKGNIIAQSDMISFNIDAQRASAQMLESVGSIGLGLFGGLLSSGGGKDIPEGYKKCDDCNGEGQVRVYNSDGTLDYKKDCETCRGKGYAEKDFWDYGEERLHESIKEDARKVNGGNKNTKQKQQQQREENVDGFGGLLEGLLGF